MFRADILDYHHYRRGGPHLPMLGQVRPTTVPTDKHEPWWRFVPAVTKIITATIKINKPTSRYFWVYQASLTTGLEGRSAG